MDTIHYIHGIIIPAAFKLLPPKMNSKEAEAEVLAIGLQESQFEHRHQMAGGPAGSFFQFEDNGVKGVMNHDTTRNLLRDILVTMRYPLDFKYVQDSMDHNDILAVVLTRLLLWTHPSTLPLINQPNKGWAIYLSCWRPGKPHPETWERNFSKAWAVVNGG